MPVQKAAGVLEQGHVRSPAQGQTRVRTGVGVRLTVARRAQAHQVRVRLPAVERS